MKINWGKTKTNCCEGGEGSCYVSVKDEKKDQGSENGDVSRDDVQ